MICFQMPQGLNPPIISMCNYNPFSIPTMWNFVQTEEHPSPSPEFDKFKAVSNVLRNLLAMNFENNSEFETKFETIGPKLYAMSSLFTLLRNIPNMTFDQIFDKLGPKKNDTIELCTKGIKNKKCTNITEISFSQFPKCFQYATSADIESNNKTKEMKDGISNGVTFVLNTGVQLSAKAFSLFEDAGKESANVLFGLAYKASSANGIRLMISPPGESPNIDEQGVNISPGQFSLIAITAKEIVRQPWPYSECTTVDYEMQRLQETILRSTGLRSNISEGEENQPYSQKECRSACRQWRIYEQCNCLDPESRLPFKNIEGRHLCGGLGSTETLMFLNPDAYGKRMCFTEASELLSSNCGFLMKVINNLYCVENVYQTFSSDSECNCAVACKSYEYELSISQSVWPAAGFESRKAYMEFVDTKHWDNTFGPGQIFTNCHDVEQHSSGQGGSDGSSQGGSDGSSQGGSGGSSQGGSGGSSQGGSGGSSQGGSDGSSQGGSGGSSQGGSGDSSQGGSGGSSQGGSGGSSQGGSSQGGSGGSSQGGSGEGSETSDSTEEAKAEDLRYAI